MGLGAGPYGQALCGTSRSLMRLESAGGMASKGKCQGEGYYSAAWLHGGLAAGVRIAPANFHTLKYSYIRESYNFTTL